MSKHNRDKKKGWIEARGIQRTKRRTSKTVETFLRLIMRPDWKWLKSPASISRQLFCPPLCRTCYANIPMLSRRVQSWDLVTGTPDSSPQVDCSLILLAELPWAAFSSSLKKLPYIRSSPPLCGQEGRRCAGKMGTDASCSENGKTSERESFCC